MYKYFYILIGLLLINTANAQFLGGNNDGFASAAISQSACTAISADYVFYGGNNDGFGYGTIRQSTCAPVTPTYAFYGGNNDGFGFGTVSQSTCAPQTPTFVFYGGINDGFGYGTVSQSTCAPQTPTFVFYGGINDGFGYGTIAQSTCAPITPTFAFYGGIKDGFGFGTVNQSTCAPITPTYAFYGGQKDGHGYGIAQQTICTNITPLPISLLYFTVKCDAKKIVFNWATMSETNNRFFTIEKSEDANTWNALAIINGSGNSTKQKEYTYTTDLIADIEYYRLKQTDFDGNSDVSWIVSSNCQMNNKFLSVYPNPTKEKIYLNFLNITPPHEIYVVNTLGEIVLTSKFNYNTIVELNLSSFNNGVYFIKFSENQDKLKEIKIVLMK